MRGIRIVIGIVAVMAIAWVSPATAERQPKVDVDKAITGEPLGLLFNGVLSGQYEMQMSDKNSLAFRGGIGGKSFGTDASYFTFMAGGMYRFWPMERVMQEWYWGPTAGIFIMSIDVKNPINGTTETSTGFGLGLGAEGGYQYIFPSGFTLDGAIGLQLVFGSLSAGSGSYEVTVPMSGLYPYLRAGIGYAWK
jgi:hypothetical protein